MMKYIKILLLFTFSLFFLVGCKEEISKSQLREMQTRIIKTTPDKAFIAARTVFIDYGYTVKESEMSSGFIQAETGEKPQKGCLGIPMQSISEKYLLNCNIESYTTDKVRVRISLQQDVAETHTNSGYYGLFSSSYQTKNSNIITDPQTYESLFNEIETEIARRK